MLNMIKYIPLKSGITKAIIYKILIIIVLVFAIPQISLASNNDTIASLIIDDVTPLNSSELRFSLRLVRHSEEWTSYANGTYQIVFSDPNYKIDKSRNVIKFTNKTDLKLYHFVGDEMPIDGYAIDYTIHDSGRISIMIAGPELFQDAKLVPLGGNGILIGEFEISALDSVPIPEELKWMEPYHLYQACAYKLENDSMLNSSIIWNSKDSNIELFDSLNSFINYTNRNSPRPDFILDYFKAKYEGQKLIGLSWQTSSEAFSLGMTVRRGERFNYTVSPEYVQYTTLVDSFSFNPLLVGTGRANEGGFYYLQDTVPDRGVDYCYELSFWKKDKNGIRDSIVARSCVAVPNAVIYEATAAPNPFKESTEIMFWVEDDVTLSAYVRDVQGRDVAILCTNKEFKQNLRQSPHILTFTAPNIATAALYDVLLVAKPINDRQIKQSTANIKVQLIR